MERIAVTVRLPKELLLRAKKLKNDGGSFNDLITKALEAEMERRYWDELLRRVDQHREQTFQAHGLLSDSAPLIRELREGAGRRG